MEPDDKQSGASTGRRFDGSGLRPKAPAPDAQTPEVIPSDQVPSFGSRESIDDPYAGGPFGGSGGGLFGGDAGGMFGSRSFGGGRIKVVGCSPGCLALSLIVSILLTLLLNALL